VDNFLFSATSPIFDRTLESIVLRVVFAALVQISGGRYPITLANIQQREQPGSVCDRAIHQEVALAAVRGGVQQVMFVVLSLWLLYFTR
jgi:hypothetical protein